MRSRLAGFAVFSLFVLMMVPVNAEVTEVSLGKNFYTIDEKEGYKIIAKAYGEPLDFHKHNFKVEIKAPTFYDMEIRQDEGVYMRFLLDL